MLSVIRPLLLLTALLFASDMSASVADTLRVSLRYRQGSALVDSAYGCNDSVIASLRRLAAEDVAIDSFSIVSSASPEGTARFNRGLSARRSAAALGLLSQIFSADIPAPDVRSMGVDYDGLKARIGLAPLDSIYPELRVSKITIVIASRRIKAIADSMVFDVAMPSVITLSSPSPDTLQLKSSRIILPRRHTTGTRIALSTNLLYDALAIPTLGVNLLLPRGLAVCASGMYAWWGGADCGRYWRAQGVGLSLKRYFGREPMSGHHLGIYGDMLRYDFSHGSRGQLSGGSGTSFGEHPTWAVGVDYGYSLRLGRHLRFDLSLGVGYATGRYQTYRINDGHSIWQSTRLRRYFGPAKAEASIVWLIGKGGAR